MPSGRILPSGSAILPPCSIGKNERQSIPEPMLEIFMKHHFLLLIISLSLAQAQTVPAEKEPVPPAMAESHKKAASQKRADIFDDHLPRTIQCQFECVELSHEEMTRLLFLRDQSMADATELRKDLQEMVAKGKAKVVDTMLVVVRSGQKTTSIAAQEYIYPTAYEPCTVPNSPSLPEKKITEKDVHVLEWLRTPPMPSSFEPREVGNSLEVEALLGYENRHIDLKFTWEIVDHHGEKSWMSYSDSLKNIYKIEMPIFYAKRIRSAITCIASQYSLVGVVDPQDAAGKRDPSRKWMVFAKCEVQMVK